MLNFLTDEDMPRSLAPRLRGAGFDATDVRDVGLRGHTDLEVFAYAVAHGSVLITADMGFANVLHFPQSSHVGIVIVRFPNEVSATTQNTAVLSAIEEIDEADFAGSVLIVEPGRVRMRRQHR